MNKRLEFRIRKILLVIFIIILIVGVYFSIKFALSSGETIGGLELNSKNVYVYNITDEKVEFSKRKDKKLAPASLTKLMTVLVALDYIEDFEEIAPIDVDSYRKIFENNASMAGFYGNEPTRYRDLLYGTILPSGGECARSLAINIAGSEEEFVILMNEKAKELGLKNTNYKSSVGLDQEGHYSSAEDIGKILKYGYLDKDFRKILTSPNYLSTETIDHPQGLYMESTVLSKLTFYEQKGFRIFGGKSGTTKNAGYCWATLVEKNGKEYICIVMGNTFNDSELEDGHIKDTLNIMEYI